MSELDTVDWLIKFREGLGVTQQDLEHRLGWPQGRVSKIERGYQRLNVQDLYEMVRALGHTLQITTMQGAAGVGVTAGLEEEEAELVRDFARALPEGVINRPVTDMPPGRSRRPLEGAA